VRKLLLLSLLLAGCAGGGPSAPSGVTAHYALLHWQASPSPNVLYRVYRAGCLTALVAGICVNQESPFRVADNLADLGYEDDGVISSKIYSYWVTAFYPSDGLESGPSNVVTVTIP
jgi:hypothetical protein